MGRKSINKDQRERRYIRISSTIKWKQIDKLSTLDRYANSFNLLINDALDYGLPMLIKEAFGEIDHEEESKQYEAEHTKEEEFYGQVVRLFRETIMNLLINKTMLCSLFEAKRLALHHKPVSPYVFETGGFQDTPEFLEAYERRELKKLHDD